MVGGQLPLPQLRDELLRLAAAIKAKHRPKVVSQFTSELAGLLYEARRRNASKTWGYATLGAFANSQLQLRDEAFAKYQRAGKNLFKFYPQQFDALLAAVAQGTNRPALLEVSKLETLHRHAPDAIDALQRGSSLRVMTGLRDLERFGSASEEEKDALRALDKVLGDIADVRAKLELLKEGTLTTDGRDRLVQRLESLGPSFNAFWEQLDAVGVMLRRGSSRS